jgi:FixJ family two-component response regulator
MAPARPLIVVVDDDASMGRATGGLLFAAGFRARVFGSARSLQASRDTDGAGCPGLDPRLPGVMEAVTQGGGTSGRRPTLEPPERAAIRQRAAARV